MSQKQRDNLILDTDQVGGLLLKFALPSIAAFLITSLYNIADQVFIGNSDLGYLGNAATSIVFPLTVIGFAIALLCGDGAAAYASLLQGKKCPEKIHQVVGNSLWLCLIGGVALTIVGWLAMTPLLKLFGASDTSLPVAREYFQIIFSFISVYMLVGTLSPIIRSDGAPGIAMTVTLSGAILNIILDPIFIFVFHWGIAGAAWATIIGQIVSLVLGICYLPRAKNFQLKPESFKIDPAICQSMLRLGFSSWVAQMAIVATALVSNFMLARFGADSQFGSDIPVAVIGIVMKVFSIVLSLTIGVMLGAQPLLGFNFGAGKYARVKKIYKLVALISLTTSLIATALFEFCPDLIINIFGVESDLYLEFARLTFRIFLSLVSVTCWIKITSIFFQAVGQPKQAAIISLTRDGFCFIPLALILPLFIGVTGVLWAAPIADIIGGSVSALTLAKFWRQTLSQPAPAITCELAAS